MKIATTKQRILLFIESKGITKQSFYQKTGMKRGFLDGDKLETSIPDTFVATIIASFPELDLEWLLTGKGEMLKSPGVVISDSPGEGVPYYNLPVSAGHSTHEIIGSTKPDGYITNLPGADLAQAILPVTGMSMQPEIMPGALIGVRLVNNWESLNTERIYMIITRDDRMIKRIEHDNEDPQVLWCVSPNYQKFKIYKSEIIEIHRVCFVYNAK